MDVHLIILIIEGIAALDRKLQKSLATAIPQLGRLRTSPAETLSEAPIVIGPKRRQALSLVIGVIAGILIVVLLVILKEQAPKPPKFDPTRLLGVIASFAVTVLAVRSIVLRLSLGGEMVLRPEGVQLAHRSRIVFLPWEMFNTGGEVFQPEPKVAVVPINPTVPVAVSKSGGEVHACLIDDVPSQSVLAVSGSAQIALRDRYEVAIGDLARLIREVSERLCGRPDKSDDHPAAPLVMAQGDGWHELQLTRLPFPPLCMGCGEEAYSTLKQAVAAHRAQAQIEVPFCESCGHVRSRRIRSGALIGASIGIAIGVALAIWIGANDRVWRPRKVAILATVFGVMGAASVGAIGGVIGRDTATPLKWRKFRPENGTVQFKHRWPLRAARFLEALGINTRPQPTETASEV